MDYSWPIKLGRRRHLKKVEESPSPLSSAANLQLHHWAGATSTASCPIPALRCGETGRNGGLPGPYNGEVAAIGGSPTVPGLGRSNLLGNGLDGSGPAADLAPGWAQGLPIRGQRRLRRRRGRWGRLLRRRRVRQRLRGADHDMPTRRSRGLQPPPVTQPATESSPSAGHAPPSARGPCASDPVRRRCPLRPVHRYWAADRPVRLAN